MRAPRREGGPLLLSIVLHVVLGAGLIWVVSLPPNFSRFFQRERAAPIPVERIGFLSIPRGPVTTPGRSGGDGRPVRTKPRTPPPPIVAPPETPSTIAPAPPAAPPKPDEGGSGPVVGRGGSLPGMAPAMADPRLWVTPDAPVVVAPKTMSQRIEREVAARIQAHNDSVQELAAADAARRKPGDWTFEKNGKKYGLDQHNIYIGDHKIPSAILALLPLNVQGNPIANEREKTFNAQHAEIMEQAQRLQNDAEFKEALKRIRARRERERREAEEAKRRQQAQTAGAGAVP